MTTQRPNNLDFDELAKDINVSNMFKLVMSRYKYLKLLSEEQIETAKNNAMLLIYNKWNPERSKLITYAYNVMFYSLKLQATQNKKFNRLKTVPIDAVKTSKRLSTTDNHNLNDILDSIKPEHKKIIMQRLVDRLTYKEIAELNGCNPDIARNQYLSAIESCKKLCIIH